MAAFTKLTLLVVLSAFIHFATASTTELPTAATLTAEPAKCPSDSVSVEGECQCDLDLCTQPECESHQYLRLASDLNTTKTPGNCCPKYSCLDCPPEDLVAGKCRCVKDEEAFFNEFGLCECVDPHRKLTENGSCVCEPNSCELPNLCDERSVPVKYSDGCCENYQCILCPEDSHPYPVHDLSQLELEVESKCVCSECPEVLCPPGLEPSLTEPGTGFPNSCCSRYQCLETQRFSCNVSGVEYEDGATWSDHEHYCKCRGGISFCDQSKTYESCEADDGTIYPHQGLWDVDNCTSCRCEDGLKKCISHMCDTNLSFSPNPEPPGCPTMDFCTKNCEYGFKTKQGCAVCKCRLPDKTRFKQLESVMSEYNYTEQFVLDLLSDYRGNLSRLVVGNVSGEPNQDDITVAENNNHELSYAIVIIASVVLILILFWAIVWSYRRYKNTTCKYKTVKVKESMNSENNNIKNICPTNNLELQSMTDIKYNNEKIKIIVQ